MFKGKEDLSKTQNIEDIQKALKDVSIGSDKEERNPVNRTILEVYEALNEKGYNPVNQIVGYIISGDPTYITSFKDARKKMAKLEQDVLLEEIVKFYINNNL